MLRGAQTTLLAGLLASPTVWADIVIFNNGDQLHGTLVSMEQDSMVFNSAAVGKITISMDKVRSFSTDSDTTLYFEDGTVVNQPIDIGEGRTIELSGGDVVSPRAVPLSAVSGINPPPPEPIEWKGRVTIGYTLDRGNTNSQDASVDINAKRETDKDRISLDAEYYEKREEDPDTGNDYSSKRQFLLGGHYDYFIADGYYVYGTVTAEKEATANLDLRLNIGSGVGYRLINNDTTEVDLEAGLSWVNESFSDDSEDNDYVALRTGWSIEHDISASTQFFHYGQWLPSLEDSDDQLVKTETGVHVKVNGSLYVEGKVLYDWDQTPAIGKDKEDTTYILGVGWDF